MSSRYTVITFNSGLAENDRREHRVGPNVRHRFDDNSSRNEPQMTVESLLATATPHEELCRVLKQ